MSHWARLSFNCGKDFVRKLDRAREVLRHKFPAGKCEDIFNEALEGLLDRRDPARARPCAGSPVRTRYIPQWVRDEVWRRDRGRCAYVGLDERRCTVLHNLEYDHIVPFGLGGKSNSPENIRLLCRPHNRNLGKEVLDDLRGL